MTVASATLPGRSCRIQTPMSSAIGIVAAIVNRPHGLSRSALTTTSASTASRMIMIAKIATIAAMPATGLISSFAIWPSDLPSRRIDAHRIDEVLHRAAEDDADDQPDRAGQEAELRGERRPDERPGAGDGREVMAEEHPLRRRHEVAAVVEPLGRRGAPRRRARRPCRR